MAARNEPAGIRSLVYGMGKGKAGIEGLRVSGYPSADIDVYHRPKKLMYFLSGSIDLRPYENSYRSHSLL
jgi:hypothetical protein